MSDVRSPHLPQRRRLVHLHPGGQLQRRRLVHLPGQRRWVGDEPGDGDARRHRHPSHADHGIRAAYVTGCRTCALPISLNADGSFTYTPAVNFNGGDSFTYRASDGGLETNLATVTLADTATHHMPTTASAPPT